MLLKKDSSLSWAVGRVTAPLHSLKQAGKEGSRLLSPKWNGRGRHNCNAATICTTINKEVNCRKVLDLSQNPECVNLKLPLQLCTLILKRMSDTLKCDDDMDGKRGAITIFIDWNCTPYVMYSIWKRSGRSPAT